MIENEKGLISLFKVYPGKQVPFEVCRKRFYYVAVFSSRHWMMKAFHKIQSWRKEADKQENFAAIVMPMYRTRLIGEEWVEDIGTIGFVLFYENQLVPSVIAHECVHMVRHLFDFANPEHLKLTEDDEPFAYCVQSCMKQIVVKYNHANSRRTLPKAQSN